MITNHCLRKEMKLTFLYGRILTVPFDATQIIFTGITYAGKRVHAENKTTIKHHQNFLLSVATVKEETPYFRLVCSGDIIVVLNETTIDDSQELKIYYELKMMIQSVSDFTQVVFSITPSTPIVFTFLQQRYS